MEKEYICFDTGARCLGGCLATALASAWSVSAILLGWGTTAAMV